MTYNGLSFDELFAKKLGRIKVDKRPEYTQEQKPMEPRMEPYSATATCPAFICATCREQKPMIQRHHGKCTACRKAEAGL